MISAIKLFRFFCFKHTCTHARNSYNHRYGQHDSWFLLCHSGNIIIILLRSDYSIPELVTFNEWIYTYCIVDVHGTRCIISRPFDEYPVKTHTNIQQHVEVTFWSCHISGVKFKASLEEKKASLECKMSTYSFSSLLFFIEFWT